jgi:hypothetical protein
MLISKSLTVTKKPLLVVGEGVHGTSEGTKRSELFISDLF